MSTTLLNNKENSSEIFLSKSSVKLNASINGKHDKMNGDMNRSTGLVTPKVFDRTIINAKNENTIGKHRRALGDLMNTAPRQSMGVYATPKSDKFLAEKTPCISSKKVELNGKKNQAGIESAMRSLNITEQENDAPVERFIGSKYDNFDDMFPDGRLSEDIMNKRPLPMLPTRHKQALMDENINPYKPISDKAWNKSIKQLKTSMNKYEKMDALTEHELPSLDNLGVLLEDLLDS